MPLFTTLFGFPSGNFCQLADELFALLLQVYKQAIVDSTMN